MSGDETAAGERLVIEADGDGEWVCVVGHIVGAGRFGENDGDGTTGAGRLVGIGRRGWCVGKNAGFLAELMEGDFVSSHMERPKGFVANSAEGGDISGGDNAGAVIQRKRYDE